MAKRFTDTDKFNDVWYRKLPILQKCIWEYLLAECNHAGILENFDLEMMSFKIGEQITISDLDAFKDRITFIDEKTLFIPKFIEFQYGTLNPQSKVHSSVLKELEKYSIDRVSIEYGKGIDTLKDKNKNIYKDKINNKDINKVINTDNVISIKSDPYINPTKKYFVEQAKEILGFKPYLDAQMCNKLIELSAEIDDFTETIPIVLKKIKNKSWNFADGKKDVNINWLLKESNYVSVLNGAFDYETREEIVARLEKAELERRKQQNEKN